MRIFIVFYFLPDYGSDSGNTQDDSIGQWVTCVDCDGYGINPGQYVPCGTCFGKGATWSGIGDPVGEPPPPRYRG